MKNTTKKVIFGILVLLNCITIFYFSNKMGDDSSLQSNKVVNLIAQIIPAIGNMQEPDKTIFLEQILTPIVRKTAHFSIYALLGILTVNYTFTYKGRSFYQKGLIALMFCMFYAITDEIHQAFIPGRSNEIRDVLIDTLGALIGISICIFITKIYRKIRKEKKNENKIDKNTKILFISSTGGHFSELMQLTPIMEKCNYHIVTEKTQTNKNLKQKYTNKIDFLVYGTKKNKILYPFILLINSLISLYVFIKIRPQVIITTGTHTAGPMCCIAKILGSKVIYIETFANRTTKTEAGKLIYFIADTFIIQWDEMQELYPKAKNYGWIY